MKFSIIIPAYNAKKTIKACLESVRKQTFSDFEAIIVDDGSSDGTHLTAEEFVRTDPRFRCIRQENRGVSAARNYAIAEAKGEFIVFLDSDDRYDRAYLQEFYEMIALYPDYDHFWCGFRSVAPNGKDMGCTIWPEGDGRYHIHDRAQIMDLHEKTLDAALWNKVFRRQILETHRICLDETMSLGEDLLFNFAYLDVCKPQIVINSNPLYLYTKADNGSLDSKYRQDLKEIYDVMNGRLLVYLQQWNVSDVQLTKYYNSVFYTMERILYNTYRPECVMTPAEKRRYNNALLKSDHFQSILKKTNCTFHPLYLRAYQIACWELVMVLDGLVNLKKRLMRK